MLVLRRAIALVLALALVVAVSAASANLLPTPGALIAKAKKGKAKKCGKGYVQKTVTKHGKKVKVCKKKGKKAVPVCKQASANASCAIPGPVGLFEAPGKVLEGDAAKPFLEKYFLNSTFTDCVRGWPECVGGQENRYSHARDFTFYKCFLRPTSGSDVKSVGTYNAEGKVEPGGDWYVREVISWYSEYDVYEWHVLQNGVVEGANQPHPPDGPSEKLAPLTYVGGIAKDCSY